jgi:hypothetical protein
MRTLAHDLMTAVSRGEIATDKAFAKQAERDAGEPAALPASAPLALALVTRAVIERLGPSLAAACAARGVRLELRECYDGYRAAMGSEHNVITWGMKLRHADYLSGGRNVLFIENGLLSQRHGVYMDGGGYFAHSSIVAGREWEREPTATELAALAAHVVTEFGGSGHDPAGPVMVALQTPNDAPIQHYLTRPAWDGLGYVIDAAAQYLPAGVPVILRPHPRHEFDPRAYRIPDTWTLERGGNVYERMRTCRAVVTANSTLGIEALAMGLPVACLGRHAYSGSGAVMECDGTPARLATLLSWEPDPRRAQALLCAVMRRQIAYRATAAEIEALPAFQAWTARCHIASPTPAGDGYAAAAMRIRCRRDPILWALVDATDSELARCKPCSRGRHQRRIVEADRTANGGAPILSGDLCGRLASAGLEVVRPDLTGYADRLCEIQQSAHDHIELPPGDVALGFCYGGHLGDTLCTTPLVQPLRDAGHTVYVVRHHHTIPVFAGFGMQHRNNGRLRLNPPGALGPGHVIQRLQRWFGFPEEPYPRPDIRIDPEETAWATEYCREMPRPIILASTGTISNGNEYPTMPWAAWGAVLADGGTVVQCIAADTDPLIPAARMATDLSARQWFALFGQASAYVGTWAAGIHCAAAFGLEALVMTQSAVDPRRFVFPLPVAHIVTFLYPQHAYGVWRQ